MKVRNFLSILCLLSVASSKSIDKDVSGGKEEGTTVISVTEVSVSSKESNEKVQMENDENEILYDNYAGDSSEIVVAENVELTQLRLRHLYNSTSDDIENLKKIQKQEFRKNKVYKAFWKNAKKRLIEEDEASPFISDLNNFIKSSKDKIPEEYLVALLAFATERIHVSDIEEFPVLLNQDFNQKLNDICSGLNVDQFQYKTYFKLLILAIKALETEKFFTETKIGTVYRGVTKGELELKEGQVVGFQQMIRTTQDTYTAEKRSANKKILEISGKFSGNAIFLEDKFTATAFKEVLISPMQTFKVKSKTVDGDRTRFILEANDASCKYTTRSTSNLN